MTTQLELLKLKNNSSKPIYLINQEHYKDWLAKQSAVTQNWLNGNNYEGKGAICLPDSEGKISHCLFGLSSSEDYFIAGDLPTLLPAGDYHLDLNSAQFLPGDPLDIECQFATSWLLASYKFDRYTKKDKLTASLCLTDKGILDKATNHAESINLVRDLVNTPASDMMPEDLASCADRLADQYNAVVSHIVDHELLDQNYPTIHAVGRASEHRPRLIDLRWGDANHPKVTLVGKGVCFDSGGLDIKPSGAMRLMKKDMGGAAHVLGLAKLIMSEELPVNLRVLVPAVENAVSSNAFRPGDVLTTRQGITVEIDNTDAEGRLVLCDALTEADSENPDLIFDFATLTGACRVALGTELPGFFCNDVKLAQDLINSGTNVQDPVWQLPLHKPYQDMLRSDIADTLNSAATGFGGAITAALYLQLFVSENTPWVHFDVMAWNNRKLPGRPIGGEAFAVRAVFDLLSQRYLD